MAATAFVVSLLTIPAQRGDRARRLDMAGMLFSSVGLAAAVCAVIDAGDRGLTPRTAAAIGLAVVSVAAFITIESRAKDPLLPLGLLRSPAFVVANLVAGAMSFVGIGTVFVLTLYLQEIHHLSPLVGGLALLPLFLPLAVLSPITGRLSASVGPHLPMGCGLFLGAAGSASLILVTPTSGYVSLLPRCLGLGLGMGLLTTAVVVAALRAVLPAQAGLGSSVTNVVRQVGGALG